MKLIDVTLRDGGHQNNFNWPINFAKDLYKTISKCREISYIELGYWKQKAKSVKKFYNLNYSTVKKITGNKNLKNISVMIDYHYCSKNIKDYPTIKQNKISMIRICSRKEDIEKALKFADKLKIYTKLNISFNVFNTTNYAKKELIGVCKKIIKSKIDCVYFADTHGDIDLNKDFKKFTLPFKILKKNKKKIGFHLHDHSGKGFYNFKLLNKFNINISDASIRGMGKGFGNLRMENVIKKKNLKNIVSLIKKYEKILTMYQNPYTLITSKYAISDNYATEASNKNISISKFDKICSKIKGREKDSYNKDYISLKY